MSIDPSTARRQFKRHYGMTFQAYHRARRMGLALRSVQRGNRVEEVRNGSGFGSESGFRDAFERIFGQTPAAAKMQGALLAQRIETPLGAMLAIADDEGLRLLEFVDRRALERELSILRSRLKNERCSRREPTSGCDPDSGGGLFRRQATDILIFRSRRLAHHSNCATGRCSVRSRRGKLVRIPGWRNS